MAERFGSFLGDGEAANQFRFEEVLPALDLCDAVVFDFGGVENMTHSFANACFANLAIEKGAQVRQKVRFVNCSEIVRVFVRASLDLGLSGASRRIAVA